MLCHTPCHTCCQTLPYPHPAIHIASSWHTLPYPVAPWHTLPYPGTHIASPCHTLLYSPKHSAMPSHTPCIPCSTPCNTLSSRELFRTVPDPKGRHVNERLNVSTIALPCVWHVSCVSVINPLINQSINQLCEQLSNRSSIKQPTM